MIIGLWREHCWGFGDSEGRYSGCSLYVFEWKSDMAVDHIISRTRYLTRPHKKTMSVSLSFARSSISSTLPTTQGLLLQ